MSKTFTSNDRPACAYFAVGEGVRSQGLRLTTCSPNYILKWNMGTQSLIQAGEQQLQIVSQIVADS